MKYAIAGIELLATDSWQHQYDLSLVLHEEAAETAYLSGDFLAMEQWVAIVLQEARTILDEVKVHEVTIKTYVAQTHKLDAIKVGLQVLAKLGLNLPIVSIWWRSRMPCSRKGNSKFCHIEKGKGLGF